MHLAFAYYPAIMTVQSTMDQKYNGYKGAETFLTVIDILDIMMS